MTISHPAVNEYLHTLTINARKDLLRDLIEAADNGWISDERAALTAQSCGITLTEDCVEDLRGLAYDAAHPDVALDRLEFDHGPQSGDRHDLLERIRAAAQQDYDEWVTRIAEEAVPVSVETAARDILTILGSER